MLTNFQNSFALNA